jgi:hypothetical protein
VKPAAALWPLIPELATGMPKSDDPVILSRWIGDGDILASLFYDD